MRITFSTEHIYTETETRHYMNLFANFQCAQVKYDWGSPEVEAVQGLLRAIKRVRTIPISLRNETAARDESLSQLEDECSSLIQGQ